MKRKHIYLSLAISLILVLSLLLMGAGGCPSERYHLTINVSPAASGSVSPSGGNYDPGVTVTITATANSGYTFYHWSGAASGSDPTTTVVMDADKEITAHFVAEGMTVLFYDDFSDPSSGWNTIDLPTGQTSYQDGYFYIEDAGGDGGFTYSGIDYPLTDFTLDVETWLVDGSEDNYHQVLCRLQEDSSCYIFAISADGHYLIDKIINGSQTILKSGQSEHINTGKGAVNSMHIECLGSNLSLSVNGYLMAAVTDTSLSDGYLSLAASAFADEATEVAFDNLVVYVPAGYTGGGETGGGETGGDTGGGETDWTLLFSDDFTDASSGWAIFDEPSGQVSCPSYLNIKDYATDDTPTYSDLAYPLTDFALEVKTWLVDGTDDNWQAVLCRYQDADNYYIFAVSADSYYYIAKFVNGEEIPLGGDYSTDVYYGPGATNTVRVECIGSSLSLSVNGNLLATVTDTSFSEGYLALAAWALSDDFTEVGFDNLEVYGPASGGGDTGGGETIITPTFSDDFSQDTGKWETYDDSIGRVSYQNGCLYTKDYEASVLDATSQSSYYGTDFVLEVETWLVSGTDDNWQAVLCRFQDFDNCYAFCISADGYYQIQKFVEGEEITLVSPATSTYINQGTGAVNLMHIECVGDSLSLTVNGHLLDTVTDTTFSGGYIGLGAAALSGTYTEVAFDDLVFSEATTGGGETGGDTGGWESEGDVLLSDDFSDPSSGWEVYSDMGGEVSYKNGELHLTDFSSIPAYTESILQEYFDDFSLVVDTRLVAGHPDNWHDVFCRWQDHSNYYIFAISDNGYYAINKVVNGVKTLLSTYSSPYINQGSGAVNTMQIVCISSNLSLYVNGYLMDTVIDSNFYGGYIGFAADALDGTSTHIAFDNLVITQEERD